MQPFALSHAVELECMADAFYTFKQAASGPRHTPTNPLTMGRVETSVFIWKNADVDTGQKMSEVKFARPTEIIGSQDESSDFYVFV